MHPPGVVFQRPFPTGDPELAGFDANTADGRRRRAASRRTGSPRRRRSDAATFQKSLQTFVWQARDDDGDRLQFDVFYRLEGETDWKVLKRALFDDIYTWDTTSVPDGTYVIKVVASDAPANAPPMALPGERESSDVRHRQHAADHRRPAGTRAPRRNVVVFTVRDSALADSARRVLDRAPGAGSWPIPVDGLLDSREERFELKLEASGGVGSGAGRAAGDRRARQRGDRGRGR